MTRFQLIVRSRGRVFVQGPFCRECGVALGGPYNSERCGCVYSRGTGVPTPGSGRAAIAAKREARRSRKGCTHRRGTPSGSGSASTGELGAPE